MRFPSIIKGLGIVETENLIVKKRCPFCAHEILADAVKCQYCHMFLDNKSIKKQFSNAQPISRLVILTVLTFGLYEIYWFYRNWKHLKDYHKLDINPVLRTIGLFVPVLGLVLIYDQLKDIKYYSQAAGIEESFSPGMILLLIIIFNIFSSLPKPYWMLSFLSVLPLIVVQRVLNSYWEKEQYGMPVRSKFSGGEKAILIIGVILFILGLLP